jgi:endogenous inhibitor of DNA gyrase (YacG/DUF329 family)
MDQPKPCPICGKPAAEKTRPFCGTRCADVDLGRWFGEVYRAPAEPLADQRAMSSDDEA